MLTQVTIQRYKSLFDVTIDLEPLTVFIGPNGSGKSNVCEALFILSHLIQGSSLAHAVKQLSDSQNWQNKYWQGQRQEMNFSLMVKKGSNTTRRNFKSPDPDSGHHIGDSQIVKALHKVVVYNFSPASLSKDAPVTQMTSSGEGIANALTDILLDDRERFIELEQRFIQLVPNISRISLKQEDNSNRLRLVDKYSEHLIPASDISDGTLRILAFLVALYQVGTPNIVCFEKPENGIHPWLFNRMMELLNLVATEGITGKPVQVLITTHSPVLLNYVRPEQVRAVEIDNEGKTQIHALPIESARFQAAMEAYDGELGELWFTNLFGGNPE
jgi:predicted ATPase